MTEREAAILDALSVANWVRPKDVGGQNGTHHSKTLNIMVTKGWVKRRLRNMSGDARPSYLYHISDAGLRAWGEWNSRHHVRRGPCPHCAGLGVRG